MPMSVFERAAERWGSQILREDMGRYRVMNLTGMGESKARAFLRYLHDEHEDLHGEAEEGHTYRPVITSHRGRAHLIVGDSHTEPGQDLERFRILGRMVRELRIPVVVFIGDHWTFNSLSSYSTTSERARERVKEDLATGIRAMDIFLKAMAPYEPEELIYTTGNHDERLFRIESEYPWMEGVFGYHSFGLVERGFEVVPFLDSIRVDGVRYTHYLSKKGSRGAISGKYHAHRLLERVKYGESVTVGHSHRLQHVWSRNIRGDVVSGLVAGCFFEHTEDYAGDDNEEWWRGLVLCHDVTDGEYDLELWSMDRLYRRFS